MRPDRKVEVSCGTKKHVSSDQNSGYLLYIGDYTTQLYRDLQSHQKDNMNKSLIIMECHKGFEHCSCGSFWRR